MPIHQIPGKFRIIVHYITQRTVSVRFCFCAIIHNCYDVIYVAQCHVASLANKQSLNIPGRKQALYTVRNSTPCGGGTKHLLLQPYPVEGKENRNLCLRV
jgi:hypothetical protein